MKGVDWAACDAVEWREGFVSGAWTVKGTRIPVEAVLANARHGTEKLVEMFPGLPVEAARVILAHARPSGTLKEFDRAVLLRDVEDYPAGTVGAICDLRDGDLHCIFEADDKTVGSFPVKALLLADLAPVTSREGRKAAIDRITERHAEALRLLAKS